jgi:mycothiol synthase
MNLVVATEAHQQEALECVFQELGTPADRAAQAAKVIDEARRSGAGLPGLIEARREGRLIGAIWAQLQPGRSAAVWPPRSTTNEPGVEKILLAAAVDYLSGQDVGFAQALLSAEDSTNGSWLLEAGFEHAADLLYLASLQNVFPRQRPASELEFEPYVPENHARLEHVVEKTYQQTLDCPALNGMRSVAEVLSDYRLTGVFDPQRWLIVRHAGQDIGCLLLADHPDGGHWELVYMGLTPEARGHGWGAAIVRHAQYLTGAAGRARLMLAVDGANTPAVKMYEATGFLIWERRSVYLKRFADRQATDSATALPPTARNSAGP